MSQGTYINENRPVKETYETNLLMHSLTFHHVVYIHLYLYIYIHINIYKYIYIYIYIYSSRTDGADDHVGSVGSVGRSTARLR